MKVMSVRLDEGTYEKLVTRSEQTGIAPAVLARAYVIDGVGGNLHPGEVRHPGVLQAPEVREVQRGPKKKRKRGR